MGVYKITLDPEHQQGLGVYKITLGPENCEGNVSRLELQDG
jgi:hypothetical protein